MGTEELYSCPQGGCTNGVMLIASIIGDDTVSVRCGAELTGIESCDSWPPAALGETRGRRL